MNILDLLKAFKNYNVEEDCQLIFDIYNNDVKLFHGNIGNIPHKYLDKIIDYWDITSGYIVTISIK